MSDCVYDGLYILASRSILHDHSSLLVYCNRCNIIVDMVVNSWYESGAVGCTLEVEDDTFDADCTLAADCILEVADCTLAADHSLDHI